MRVVAFDVGLRRTGVAISDASGTLARPWQTLDGADPVRARRVVHELQRDADGLAAIVVGLPRRLDGSPTHLTEPARAFAAALEATGLPVVLVDERLTSVEAEQRLASRERDWRKRKAQLDAASAAIILQEYLDRSAAAAPATDSDDPA